jgi:hypothetical protein
VLKYLIILGIHGVILTADDNWWQDLGSMYADTVHQYGTPGYFNDLNNGITNGWDWYEVDGGRQDFMNYFKLCRESTIELSNVKTPNPFQLPNFWNINKASLVNYIKQSLYGLRGIVTDSITGQPLRSRVEIFGHDLIVLMFILIFQLVIIIVPLSPR